MSLDPWSDDVHEEEYFHHLVLSLFRLCLIAIDHIELMQMWRISLAFFCTSLWAAKTTSLENTNCLKAIPFILSELILLFSPEDLRCPRRVKTPTKTSQTEPDLQGNVQPRFVTGPCRRSLPILGGQNQISGCLLTAGRPRKFPETSTPSGPRSPWQLNLSFSGPWDETRGVREPSRGTLLFG